MKRPDAVEFAEDSAPARALHAAPLGDGKRAARRLFAPQRDGRVCLIV
jgi:hypothetical protein